MRYDVRVYKTLEDFDRRDAHPTFEGIENKEGALREGQLWLMDNAIVKVQSEDREFIQILKGRPLETVTLEVKRVNPILLKEQRNCLLELETLNSGPITKQQQGAVSGVINLLDYMLDTIDGYAHLHI